MKRGRSVVVLLVVAALLGSYIWFVEMKRPDPDTPSTEDRVFAQLDAGTITRLDVRASNGDRTVVEREGAGWRMVAPIQARADASEVAGVTSNLASLDRSRVLDESPSPDSLTAFGLDEPRMAIGFTTDTGEQTLMLGTRTVTGGDIYARLADQPGVFLVPSWLESSLDRTTFQLRDKTLTHFDRTRVDTISVIGAPGTIELEKDGDEWRLRQPVDGRADTGTVESLLGRLAAGQIKAIVAEQPATLDVYGLAPPRTTVTVSGSGERLAQVIVGAESDETAVHARDTAREMVFTVDTSLAADLERAAADYRVKSLFTESYADVTSFTVTQDGVARVFDRVTSGESTSDTTWRQTSPAAEVDSSRITDLASAIHLLRAETWESRIPAAAAPLLTAELRTSDGTMGTVRLVRSGERVLAERNGEPGAAVLALSSVDRILDLLRDPEPAATPSEDEGAEP
jgi:hypothetical protein